MVLVIMEAAATMVDITVRITADIITIIMDTGIITGITAKNKGLRPNDK